MRWRTQITIGKIKTVKSKRGQRKKDALAKRFLFFGGVLLALVFILSLAGAYLYCQEKAAKNELFFPRPPEQIISSLRSLTKAKPQISRLLTIGQSYGRRDIILLQLAAPSPKGGLSPEARPAILITAGLEGIHFLGSEAACRLAQRIAEGYGQDQAITTLLEKRTIYIAPLLNPDAASSWWGKVRQERMANDHPVDEDNDGLVDEDGPDDLNGDGLITLIRVKDPEGTWIPDPREPRLLRQADPRKGEKGIYKLYTEGLDNDGDGEINEDPPGGVLINRNFAHDFEYFIKANGLWPASEPETAAILRFMVDHPQIALVLNFSTENTILNLQQTGQARVGADRVRVPRQFASMLGLDPEREYSLQEIMGAMRGLPLPPGMEVSEEMIATFLGLGPAVAIDRQDMPIFETIQKEYREAISKAGLEYPERRAKGVGKGSFVAYCYFQYGVPVFSTDVWAVPEPKKPAEKGEKEALTPERLRAMSAEEFLSLGEEKIAAFLKNQGAPPNVSASMLLEMVRSGKVKPAQMAEMMEKMQKMTGRPAGAAGPSAEEEHPEAYLLQWSDTTLKGKGFVSWTACKHPTLGEVEVGGFVPGIKYLPPAEVAERALDTHVDFYLRLMHRVPEVQIQEVKAKALGEGVYEVSVFLTNPGWFPTSTAQGRRAMTSWPIRVKINLEKEQQLFSGQPTELVPFINGGGAVAKLTWTVRAKKGSRLMVEATSPKLGHATASIILP